jgi:hypothetical protein
LQDTGSESRQRYKSRELVSEHGSSCSI